MAISRRSLIRMTAYGCAYCLAAGRALADSDDDRPHWTYDGDSGPERWGELSEEFKTCQFGTQQTPINLTNGLTGDTGSLRFNYQPIALSVVNNGHTIQANAAPGCSCTIGDVKYELLQFHFHHPSEHLMNGKPLDLECHFVHKAASGAFAVVGVFFAPGRRNETLKPVFDSMPRHPGMHVKARAAVNPADILPTSGGFFRYQGSLTTPPCTEGLTWTVFKQPVEISREQIQQFAALFPNNARPVQPHNGRDVIEMY